MSSNTITAAYGNTKESYRIMQYSGLFRTAKNRLKIQNTLNPVATHFSSFPNAVIK